MGFRSHAFSAQELRYETTATGVIALKHEKNEKAKGKETPFKKVYFVVL